MDWGQYENVDVLHYSLQMGFVPIAILVQSENVTKIIKITQFIVKVVSCENILEAKRGPSKTWTYIDNYLLVAFLHNIN